MTTNTINRSAASATRERVPSLVARWLVSLGLASAALALYLLTLSDVHTFDALSYIRDVDQRAGFFFHPHHLLYSPTGWLFWQSWRVFGYGGGSELALKVLNSLVGAACGFGLYQLVWQLTHRWWAAFVASGLLLFNYGAWYFSVEVEVYLLALIWLIFVLVLLLELMRGPRRRTAPLLGLCVGMAALYHQTNGLLVPVVVLAFALSSLSWRERIKQLIITGAIAGGVVALGYVLVGFGYNGFRSLSRMREWMFFFVETGWWGHATRDRWTDLGAGLGNTISTEGAWPFWTAIVVLLVLGMPFAARRWPRIVALCVSWIAIYGGFFAWWEGENIEFWIATLLPLWLLVGLSVAAWGSWLEDRTDRIRPSAVGLAACVLPVLLAWHNYPLVQLRGDASQDLQRQLAAKVHAITTEADLIVSPGGVMELYLPYYEVRHNVYTLNGILFETGGDIPQAFERLRQTIDNSLSAGLSVVVGREVLELPREIFQRYPVTQAQLDAFWEPYRAALQPAVVHDGTTYFWRIPSATELATTTGWRWQTTNLGWQAANMTDSGFENGWCFVPEVDPALVSPLLNLDAAAFRAVALTMRTNAQGQQGQLFFAGPDGGMSDERSVWWELQSGGSLQTHTIPLESIPGWQGTITRLRLDPIEVGDSSAAMQTCVVSLRLMQ